MTSSAFGTITAWSYGAALVGYAVFAARVAPGFRKGLRARLLLAALVATLAWAAMCLIVGRAPSPGALLAANIADAFRYAAWFGFLASLLREAPGSSSTARPIPRPVIVAGSAIIAALIAGVLLSEGGPLARLPWLPAARTSYLLRLGIAVFGLVLVEHVVRRVLPQMRWGIRPLAVALAGVFGLDLYLYSDAALFGQTRPHHLGVAGTRQCRS